MDLIEVCPHPRVSLFLAFFSVLATEECEKLNKKTDTDTFEFLTLVY